MEDNNNKFSIAQFLPHKVPMLMVDNIVTITKDLIKTDFEIKENNFFVQNSTFSEFGLIENAAQTCSSIVGQSFFFDKGGTALESNVSVIGFISSVKNVILHQLPKSGDILSTKATLVSKVDTSQYIICTLQCKISCDDTLLLESDINLIITEKL